MIDLFGYEIRDDGKPGEIAEKMTAAPYFSASDPGRSEQDGPWQRLFIDCVKGIKSPPLNLENSHKATVCCHLANTS